MAEVKVKCFSCGTMLSFVDIISRRDECPKCGEDVRVCKNCQFYDPKVYNECREPNAEVVREKDRSNLCDFFRPASGDGVSSEEKKRADLRAAADALFKKNTDS